LASSLPKDKRQTPKLMLHCNDFGVSVAFLRQRIGANYFASSASAATVLILAPSGTAGRSTTKSLL
jgi:hypothetical protein